MKQTRSRRQHRFWLALSISAVAGLVAVALVTQRWSQRPRPPSALTKAPGSASIATTNAAPAGRPALWVLAIGVSQYKEPALKLRFAAADARTFAEAMARQQGGPLYHAVQTHTLLDAGVTRAGILRALDEFLGSAAPVDVGVIYMAGHGVRDALLGDYYFLPAAASADRPRVEGLNMEEFNRELRMLHRNLRRLVVILDTCHGGAVAGGGNARLGQDLAVQLAPAEGLYILTAAKSGQLSREVAGLGHGAFTQALLDGLHGAAADADGMIRVLGLASYAARVVPQLTEQGQTPYLSIVGEDLPLAAHPQRFAQVTPPPLFTPAAIAAAVAPRERIAIMRFENLRPDARYDWMREALGEQFATTLHQLPRFDVYDERMVRFLARGSTDPIEASRRADMTKLVNGTYWVQNDHISITAHIKNTDPLQSVASAQIDGPLLQFSELSNRIVIALLGQLQAELSPAEIERLLSRRTTDLAARKLLFQAERPGGGARGPTPTPDVSAAPAAALGAWLLGRLGVPGVSYAADHADPEADLRATLEGYRQAFEREDIDALARYYAEFTPEQRAALGGYFANADSLHVAFGDIQIAIIGDQAAISFSREDRFVDHHSGEPEEVVVRVTKLFAKGPEGWQIVPEE